MRAEMKTKLWPTLLGCAVTLVVSVPSAIWATASSQAAFRSDTNADIRHLTECQYQTVAVNEDQEKRMRVIEQGLAANAEAHAAILRDLAEIRQQLGAGPVGMTFPPKGKPPAGP